MVGNEYQPSAFISTQNNDTLVNSDREAQFRLTTNEQEMTLEGGSMPLSKLDDTMRTETHKDDEKKSREERKAESTMVLSPKTTAELAAT